MSMMLVGWMRPHELRILIPTFFNVWEQHFWRTVSRRLFGVERADETQMLEKHGTLLQATHIATLSATTDISACVSVHKRLWVAFHCVRTVVHVDKQPTRELQDVSQTLWSRSSSFLSVGRCPECDTSEFDSEMYRLRGTKIVVYDSVVAERSNL